MSETDLPQARSFWVTALGVGAASVAIVLALLHLGDDGGAREAGLQGQGNHAFTIIGASDAPEDAKKVWPREACRPGDAFRATYNSNFAYVMFVGVGPTGHARVLHASPDQRSLAVAEMGGVTPGRWTLDATLAAEGKLSRERVLAVFSEKALEAAYVLDGARRAGAGPVRLLDAHVEEWSCLKGP